MSGNLQSSSSKANSFNGARSEKLINARSAIFGAPPPDSAAGEQGLFGEIETTQRHARSQQRNWTWIVVVWLCTWLLPTPLIRCCLGTEDPQVIWNWREKVAWCWIVAILCAVLAFITYGLTFFVCDNSTTHVLYRNFVRYTEGKSPSQPWFLANGFVYSLDGESPRFSPLIGRDVSSMFEDRGACAALGIDLPFQRRIPNVPNITTSDLDRFRVIGRVAYQWENVRGSKSLLVCNGDVLDISRLLQSPRSPFGGEIERILVFGVGKDATRAMSKIPNPIRRCIHDAFYVGRVDVRSVGCLATDAILWCSLIVILSLVLIRFFFAIFYAWFGGVGRKRTAKSAEAMLQAPASTVKGNKFKEARLRRSIGALSNLSIGVPLEGCSSDNTKVVMLVTCYSEDECSLKKTVDSLSRTDYPDGDKLLFIVADGIIRGSGNDRTTPDIAKDLLEITESDSDEAYFTIALAQGSKRLNRGRVYAGYYKTEDGKHRVPAILVVKVGTEEEQAQRKPGNRGKRDSQIVLMNFFSKVVFNDRMTPLEYQIYRRLRDSLGVQPELFEAVLMVDADTYVEAASLERLIRVFQADPSVIGLCGETLIANSTASWVTAMQVFEYHISHHLSKAFESIFGGVTCLPGCFCAYRLKVRKNGGWLPLLTHPDVIASYSDTDTETLHQKNLLLLGEDRYLTTLMLKTFPCRKLLFVPSARCHTIVPDTFSVLLSQRRRWINSTVHNMLELIQVRDLCGTFCFSMQFVVFMELFGGLVLPAAIIFTGVLVGSAFSGNPQWIPLFLLLAILGLPALLVLFTTGRIVMVLWMLVYLVSLPIWNFIFPVYAFWHFDDFSWGQTRKLEGPTGSKKGGNDHGGKNGVFDWSQVPMKRVSEYDSEIK